MSDKDEAPRKTRPAVFEHLVRSHMAFRSNVRTGHAFVRARYARRPVRPRLHGVRFFAVTTVLVMLVGLVLDQPVGAFRGHWPDDVALAARSLTDIGKSVWFLVPTGVAVLLAYSLDWLTWTRRRRLFVLTWVAALGFIFFSLAAGGLIADLFKYSIGRARPTHFQELGAFAFHPFSGASFASFPSGHSTTMGGLFAALALLIPLFRIPFLLLGIALALTRILVGAHYPSDVVGGLAWGAWFSYFSAVVFARHGLIFTLDARGWPLPRSGYRLSGRNRLIRRLRRRRSRRGIDS